MGIGKQAKILTNKQQELLLTYLEKSRYPLRNKVMLLFSFKAGLRAKEIAAVTWSMVCNADGKIGTEINLTNNASKGNYSGRIIPLNKQLKNLLERLLLQKQEKLGFCLENHIIDSEQGRKTSPQAIVNWFSKLYKTVGIDGCSSHSGRRTFITNAAKNICLVGGSLNDVRLLAGHSSLATTQRYIEYNTEAHKRVVELV